jgi:hypothetical protein
MLPKIAGNYGAQSLTPVRENAIQRSKQLKSFRNSTQHDYKDHNNTVGSPYGNIIIKNGSNLQTIVANGIGEGTSRSVANIA